MGIKVVVAALTDVPEALRSEYEERDGKFFAKLEGDEIPGFVPVAKFAPFRDNNKRMMAALGAETVEAALARVAIFAGIDPAKLEKLKAIDPDEYAALKAQAEELRKKGVTKPDDIQARLDAFRDELVVTLVKPLQDKLTASERREAAKDARIADGAISEAVGSRFDNSGGRKDPGVKKFIVERARESFRVVDDKVVAIDGLYGAKGDPLTLDEWIVMATKEHAFAFEPSKGGGATGGSNGQPRADGGTFRTRDGAEVKTDGITVLA